MTHAGHRVRRQGRDVVFDAILYCICTVLLEPVLFKAVGLIFPAVLPIAEWHVLAYFTMALMIVMTVRSGFAYIKTYWSHISPNE